MTRPNPSGKKSVSLAPSPAGSGPRVSRIRRDPPPAVKPAKIVLAPDEREQWAVVVGVLTFALAIFFLTVAFGSYSGWSPREYTVEVNVEE